MTPADRFRVNAPKVVNETIDGEVVILNLDRGRYYSLTESGGRAWIAIERMASVKQIVDDLMESYDAPRSEVEAGVVRLLDELRAEEIIVTVAPTDGGDAQPTPTGGGPSENAASEPVQRVPFSPPVLQIYTDMENLLLLDPIHEADETGWPHPR